MTPVPRPDEAESDLAALWLERLLRTSDRTHFTGLLEWLHYPEAQALGADDLRVLDARIALYLAALPRPQVSAEASEAVAAWLDAQLKAWRSALLARLDALLDDDAPSRLARLEDEWERGTSDSRTVGFRPEPDLSDSPF